MQERHSPRYTARESAVYLLSRRDHSIFELRQKLKVRGYESDQVEQAIRFCLDHRYLDEERFASIQIRKRIAKGCGKYRIKQELEAKGVKSEIITGLLDQADVDWYELARMTLAKKFKHNESLDQKEYAKRARFLQYRGFSTEQIQYALDPNQPFTNSFA